MKITMERSEDYNVPSGLQTNSRKNPLEYRYIVRYIDRTWRSWYSTAYIRAWGPVPPYLAMTYAYAIYNHLYTKQLGYNRAEGLEDREKL